MSNVAIASGTVEGIASVKAGSVTVTAQKAGQLAMYGAGGVLSGDAGLTFSGGTLTAAQLGAFKATGPVDFNAQPVKNLKVTSGEISGASLVAAATLKASGALEVGADASVGGDLVVSGSVSGSGSYHDISDARFKKEVLPLGDAPAGPLPNNASATAAHAPRDALQTLRALRGVSFEFHSERPEGLPRGVRAFPQGRQFGFIAQEVEQVLPQVRAPAAADRAPPPRALAAPKPPTPPLTTPAPAAAAAAAVAAAAAAATAACRSCAPSIPRRAPPSTRPSRTRRWSPGW